MIVYIPLQSIPRLSLGKHNDDSTTKKIKNFEISQPAQIIKDSSLSPTHSMENEGKRLALFFTTKGILTTGTNLLLR